jgi:hypothetical protein
MISKPDDDEPKVDPPPPGFIKACDGCEKLFRFDALTEHEPGEFLCDACGEYCGRCNGWDLD